MTDTRRLASRPTRRPLPALVLALLLAALLPAAETERPPLLALCAAYPPELAALRGEFGVEKERGFTESNIKGLSFWRGRAGRHEIVVFRTGVSLVNAAYQLQLALERFPITAVLFAGVAGGVDPSLRVGDIVIPEQWAYHSEAAYLNPDGKGGHALPSFFQPKHENFGMIFPNEVAAVRGGETDFQRIPAFPADPGLLGAARRAVTKLPALRAAGREVAVSVGGTGVAGPVFLDHAAYREWVFRVWRARCVDMESTALAHVAWSNRVPILIVRGLSDLAGAQRGTNPIDANEAPVSGVAARVLRAIVEEL
jgi:adenosylhomocysteine nucleosidase